VATTITGIVVWRASHYAPAHAGPLAFDARWFALATGLEIVAIPLAVVRLRARAATHYILPAIAVIVGVHFLLLVPAFHYPFYGWLGVAMLCVTGVAVRALPRELVVATASRPVRAWDVAVGGGCAALLWYAAWRLLALG